MDLTEQKAGEDRVRSLLVDPLLRRGLTKPSTLTKAAFQDMISDMCARLTYMSNLNLMALEEDAANFAGGKDHDRFPIAQRILKRAAEIQRPDDGGSPLMRAMFAHQIGKDAIRDGWAPELLAHLRADRKWPTDWVVNQIRTDADADVRRFIRITEREARDPSRVSAEDRRWRDARRAVIDKCKAISAAGGSQP